MERLKFWLVQLAQITLQEVHRKITAKNTNQCLLTHVSIVLTILECHHTFYSARTCDSIYAKGINKPTRAMSKKRETVVPYIIAFKILELKQRKVSIENCIMSQPCINEEICVNLVKNSVTLSPEQIYTCRRRPLKLLSSKRYSIKQKRKCCKDFGFSCSLVFPKDYSLQPLNGREYLCAQNHYQQSCHKRFVTKRGTARRFGGVMFELLSRIL